MKPVNSEICVKSFPLETIWYHFPHNEDLSNYKMIILEEKCIGCGVGSHKCPEKSLP